MQLVQSNKRQCMHQYARQILEWMSKVLLLSAWFKAGLYLSKLPISSMLNSWTNLPSRWTDFPKATWMFPLTSEAANRWYVRYGSRIKSIGKIVERQGHRSKDLLKTFAKHHLYWLLTPYPWLSQHINTFGQALAWPSLVYSDLALDLAPDRTSALHRRVQNVEIWHALPAALSLPLPPDRPSTSGK